MDLPYNKITLIVKFLNALFIDSNCLNSIEIYYNSSLKFTFLMWFDRFFFSKVHFTKDHNEKEIANGARICEYSPKPI